MVAAIPPHSGMSAWESNQCERCGSVEVGEDDAICSVCASPLLRPVVTDANEGYRLVKGFRNSSYRRMSPDEPASTITTASGHIGSDNTIHPFENRLLSALECALLQSFPLDFDWGKALEKMGPHERAYDDWRSCAPALYSPSRDCAVRGIELRMVAASNFHE